MIPKYLEKGAAIGTVMAEAIAMGMLILLSRKYLKKILESDEAVLVECIVEKEENVYKRAHSFFLDKYEDYNNKTILVVCHGALIRIFLRELGLYPETRELIKNTALNILLFDGSNFILEKFNI